MSRPLRIPVLVALGLATTLLAQAPLRTRELAGPGGAGVPGSALPVERARTYTMSGKIRPLLFWIGRDRVGIARIVWRRGEGDARAYELLIGTDPLTAPRRLNRWGYIAEESHGADGALLALMTRSDETALEEVQAGGAGAAAGQFRAISARIEGGQCRSVASLVGASAAATFREVDALVGEVHAASGRGTPRVLAVPAGVRPGFLAAMAELIRLSAESLRDPRRLASAAPAGPVPYVYGVRLYDLKLRDHEVVRGGTPDASGSRLARGRFEIYNRVTSERTRFELTYGVDGPLAEVPVEIVYQPRWWLRVELRLDPISLDTPAPPAT